MFPSQFLCQCFHLLVRGLRFWVKIISTVNKYVLLIFISSNFTAIYMFLIHLNVIKGYHFYTELKTVTQLWKESDATDTKAAVSMPVL